MSLLLTPAAANWAILSGKVFPYASMFEQPMSLWLTYFTASRYPWILYFPSFITSYRHVKTLTEKLVADALAAIDATTPVHGSQLSLIQEHPLIQSADVYADLFARGAARPVFHPATIPGTHHEHE